MAQIVEADVNTDFSNAQVAVLEQQPRLLHSAVKKILSGRHAQATFECAEKVKGTQSSSTSQIGQRDGLTKSFVDVGLDSTKLPRRKPGAGL